MADVNLGLRAAIGKLRQETEWTKSPGRKSPMAKGMDSMNLMTDMQQVIHQARLSQEWVVIVCPSSDTAASCCDILTASIPEGSRFSGRTALLKDGGRISVVVAVEEVFIPDGTAFVVSFVGWTSKNTNDGMLKWQKKATDILRLGD